MPKRFTPKPMELTSSSWLVFISGGSNLIPRLARGLLHRNARHAQTLDSFEDDEDGDKQQEDAVREAGEGFDTTVASKT